MEIRKKESVEDSARAREKQRKASHGKFFDTQILYVDGCTCRYTYLCIGNENWTASERVKTRCPAPMRVAERAGCRVQGAPPWHGHLAYYTHWSRCVHRVRLYLRTNHISIVYHIYLYPFIASHAGCNLLVIRLSDCELVLRNEKYRFVVAVAIK